MVVVGVVEVVVEVVGVVVVVASGVNAAVVVAIPPSFINTDNMCSSFNVQPAIDVAPRVAEKVPKGHC